MTAKPTKQRISIRAMEDSAHDFSLYQACFEKNVAPRSEAWLRWQFFEERPAKLGIHFATPEGSQGSLAGIYAAFSVYLKAGNQKIVACQSMDTLTDADYRGQGIFVKLAEETFANLPRGGVSCIFGFPNGNSAPGFFNKLKWAQMDPVPFLVKPLRARYLVERITKRKLPAFVDLPLSRGLRARPSHGQTLRSVDAFDSAFDALWQRFSSGFQVGVWRDAAYLNWRLRSKPGSQYRTIALDEAGRLAGFVSFSVEARQGGSNGYIMELMHDPGRTDVGTTLLRAALAEMTEAGADLALAWNPEHAPNHPAFRAAHFIPVPTRFQPLELHFGARALTPDLPTCIVDRSSWYLSYLDSDTT